jgi:hypothetical protein
MPSRGASALVCTLAATLLAAGPAGAQAASGAEPSLEPRSLPSGCTLYAVPVRGAAVHCVSIALPIGWTQDPPERTGMAQVLGWFLHFAQRERPPAERFAVDVGPHCTVLSLEADAAGLERALALAAGLLAGRLEVDADTLALAVARAQLLADDHAWLYPGSVLEQLAWRAVHRGTPLGRQGMGIAGDLEGLGAVELKERYQGGYTSRGAVVVVIGKAAVEAVGQALPAFAALRPGRLPAPSAVDAAPPPPARIVHARSAGPYVALALPAPAPAEPGFPAFALAMTMCRTAALRAFAPLDREGLARTPPVAYRYWQDDPVVRIHRRGRDGAAAALPRRDIEDLIAQLERTAGTPAALETARVEVCNTLAWPPYRNAAPSYLAVRGRFLATSLALGWPRDLEARVQRMGAAEVGQVLASAFHSDRARWLVLHPAPGRQRSPR